MRTRYLMFLILVVLPGLAVLFLLDELEDKRQFLGLQENLEKQSTEYCRLLIRNGWGKSQGDLEGAAGRLEGELQNSNPNIRDVNLYPIKKIRGLGRDSRKRQILIEVLEKQAAVRDISEGRKRVYFYIEWDDKKRKDEETTPLVGEIAFDRTKGFGADGSDSFQFPRVSWFIFLVVFILLLTALSNYLSYVSLSPIAEVAKNLRNIREEHCTDLIPSVSRKDEIGDLVTGYNQLVSYLKESMIGAAYLNRILNSLMEAVIQVEYRQDSDRFRYVKKMNPAAEKLLGMTEGQAGDMTFDQILAEDRRSSGDLMTLLEEEGQVTAVEAVYLDSQGRRIPVIFTGVILEDPCRASRELICLAQDLTERKSQEEELKFYATKDELTEVLNRKTGLFILENVLSHYQKTGEPVTVGYVDVCGTAEVNRRDGLEEGDRYIKGAAGVLQKAVREMDTVARMEGDKFLLILPGSLEDTSSAVSRRLREGMPGSFSYGFTALSEPDISVNGIVDRAKQKMNLNKKATRRGGE